MRIWGRNERRRVWLVAGILLVLMALSGPPFAGAGPGGPVRLVVGIPGDVTSLDGHGDSDIQGVVMFNNLYDHLVAFDANSNIVPELALKWETSQDGRVWTFHLRPGHRFHDGTPVTAEAIKRNFDRLSDPKNGFRRRTRFELIKSIQVQGENTIAFTTDTFNPFLLNLLTDPTASIVSPTAAAAVDLGAFARNPVGSGPYRFREWVRGTRIVLEKNPFHWLTFLRKGNVDIIEFRPIPDSASRSVALETGEVDFVTHMEPEDAKRLSNNPNLTVYNSPRARLVALYPDLRKKPYSDVRVRYALAHAIDRQAIIDTFLFGFASPANAPVAPGVWGRKEGKPYEYDPAKARRLLFEAGYPNGFDTTLVVPVGQLGGIRQVSEAIADMLGKVGIRVKLEFMEHTAWQTFLRSGPTESKLDLSFWTWGTLTGEPDYGLRQPYHSSNWSPVCCNRNFYRNTQVDRLLEQGLVARSQEERLQVYHRAQDLIWRDLPWILLYNINHSSVGKRSVTGVKVLPTEYWIFRETRVIQR